MTDDNACADIAASDFWSWSHRPFLDVRVYSPFSSTYLKTTLRAYHHRNEQEKRRQYEEGIRRVEYGSFTPLIFTIASGMNHYTGLQETGFLNCRPQQQKLL